MWTPTRPRSSSDPPPYPSQIHTVSLLWLLGAGFVLFLAERCAPHAVPLVANCPRHRMPTGDLTPPPIFWVGGGGANPPLQLWVLPIHSMRFVEGTPSRTLRGASSLICSLLVVTTYLMIPSIRYYGLLRFIELGAGIAVVCCLVRL